MLPLLLPFQLVIGSGHRVVAFGHRSRFVFVMPPVRSPLPPPDLIAVEVCGECVPGRVEVNLVLNLVRSDLATATRAGSVATLASPVNVDRASQSRTEWRRRRSFTVSSAHSACLQTIPMSAKTQVMAAYVVTVAMASMGESLLAHGPFPAVPKVTESAGTDMTLVIGPAG